MEKTAERPQEANKMQAQVVIITPEQAQKWLDQNTANNRRVSELHVDYLSGEMTAGQWKLNGEAIKFNGTSLIDGQHRLHAVIQSGKTIESLVIRNLPNEVFDTLDTGRKRSAGDVLSMVGISNSAVLGSAASWIVRVQKGIVSSKRKRPSPQHIKRVVLDNPEIMNSVHFQFHMRRVVSPGIMVATHFLFSQKDKALTEQMFESLRTGQIISKDHPFTHLRERLLQHAISRAKLPGEDIIALFIKAWNYARQGVEIKTLIWRTRGDQPESFPKIQ